MAQTNNPRKIRVLEELGVEVTARIPCIVKAQEHNVGYLATKQARRCPHMTCDAISAVCEGGCLLHTCMYGVVRPVSKPCCV